MLSIVRRTACTLSAPVTSLPDSVNLSFSIPCSSKRNCARSSSRSSPILPPVSTLLFGIVSRHPTDSFPTCCDRISIGQQRSPEGFRAYLRQELSILLLVFLHMILRRYVQPRCQRRSKPLKEPNAAPYVPDFHWYGEYLAYSLKQLMSPAVIYSVYRFRRSCLRLPVLRYIFFDPS